ncbi:hypothetical protein AB0L57_25600 [Nocardia sp. NPDC052254]|uniref:hypothetical protein n=1 Tax=Nocardia sp. NPDC052254 TaxID=3155681 RepID=UPI0034141660
MTTAAARSAGDFLIGLAEQVGSGSTPESLRSVLERACGGRLDAAGPDGRRSSGLTLSGTPFEASLTGGRGRCAPVIRYVTETTTWEPTFTVRFEAFLAAVAELVTWLPGGNESVTEQLHSFIATLYPAPGSIEPSRRPALWLGIVHHPAQPDHLAGLKVYCNSGAIHDAIEIASRRWPDFRELSPVPLDERLLRCAGIALEVDAQGGWKHKIYLRASARDAAVPMKLIRYFGEAAWEPLAELVRCGTNAAHLHNYDYFVCCNRRDGGSPSYTVTVMAGRRDDHTGLIRELASRHHGTTHAVDAMAQAAQACGAMWRYSAVGLGFSPDYGIDKLNVYGAPSW